MRTYKTLLPSEQLAILKDTYTVFPLVPHCCIITAFHSLNPAFMLHELWYSTAHVQFALYEQIRHEYDSFCKASTLSQFIEHTRG